MRKFLALAATVILGGALLIAGCGNDNKQAASAVSYTHLYIEVPKSRFIANGPGCKLPRL